MKILGKHYADFLEVTPIEFWFTMPALWSDKSQHTTRVAAQRAGFGSRPKDTIRMITEPEAGVIAAMNAQMKSVEGMLKVCPFKFFMLKHAKLSSQVQESSSRTVAVVPWFVATYEDM